MNKPPLILTLKIEEEAFLYFNMLRQRHFPAERNFIDAHLTLFHALPNNTFIIEDVKKMCVDQTVFSLFVKEIVSIGKGVAFKIESKELKQLHRNLLFQWKDHLTLQDQQNIWPHITVQNKVEPGEATRLATELRETFQPFITNAIGLQLWEYLNGPWKAVQLFNFQNLGTRYYP